MVPAPPALPASFRRRVGGSTGGIGDRVKALFARLSPARLGPAREAPEGAQPRRRGLFRSPAAFAFVGSGCLLVLEIVAGRMLAPVVGVSLYSWTSVIGVVLAGLSIGNWLGGRIADRWPGRSTLSMLYLISAFSTAFIVLLGRNLQGKSEAVANWAPQLHVL